MTWKRLIKRGEKVGLELTPAEPRLLLTGLVFLHGHVEEAVRSTPPGEPVMLTLGDLDDLAGHVAGEANHAEDERTEDVLSHIDEKIEGLLDLYAEDDRPTGAAKPEIAPNDLLGLLANREPIVFPMPKRPGRKGQKYPIRMTPHQRASVLDHADLRPGLRRKIEQTPEGTEAVEFTRKELDELYDGIGGAIVHALSPHKKRLTAVHDKIAAIFDDEQLVAYGLGVAKKAGLIYQLKVTLAGVEPPVWRRVQVPDGTLGDLHFVIQAAMGWQDSHLHQFDVDGTSYGPVVSGDLDTEGEEGVLLSQVIPGPRKVRFVYEYDFGDSWEHEVLFETAVEPEPKLRYPRCIDGARACPPEDCGGVWGYADFLEAMADPKHENHRDMKEWIGGRFDPEKFSAEAVNKRLRKL
jgi:hypothetical protein